MDLPRSMALGSLVFALRFEKTTPCKVAIPPQP
jgi:hypothetical protein